MEIVHDKLCRFKYFLNISDFTYSSIYKPFHLYYEGLPKISDYNTSRLFFEFLLDSNYCNLNSYEIQILFLINFIVI